MSHSIDNTDFLQAIFGNLPEDETVAVCLFDESPDDVKFWRVHDAAEPLVRDAMAEISNAFFCLSSVTRQTPLNRRQASCKATYVIPLDDIGKGKGAKTAPEAVPLKPTYSIETSPGNFQYGYVLEAPLDNLAEARALIKIVAQTADAGGAMVNKLIRLPYGKNSKAKYGTPAPATKLHIWEPDRLFTVEDLLAAWNVSEEAFNQIVNECKTHVGLLAGSAKVGPQRQPDDVLGWLDHTGMLLSDTPNPSGYFEIRCPWADSHSSGKDGGAGWSPIGYGGPEYEQSQQFTCLHDHCRQRGEYHLLSWMYASRFVYCTSQDCVYDILHPRWRSKTLAHFKTMFATDWARLQDPETGRSKIHKLPEEWLTNKNRVTVAKETFNPAADAERIAQNSQTGDMEFNTYVPGNALLRFVPGRDKIYVILDHLRYLFGSEYENALGFLAYTVHRPEIRLSFALLHTAYYHGTGRGWLKKLIGNLVGPEYFNTPSFHNYLNTNYNEFLYRSLVVAFDEVYDQGNKYTVGERLREMVTEEEVEINVKHGFKGTQRVHATFMFFSNHRDAIKIGEQDRRFWVVSCDEKPKDSAYYEQLYAVLEDQEALCQFWSFLKEHLLVTSLKPTGNAPKTEWTEETQSATYAVNFTAPIREVVQGLREQNCKAVYRTQLVSDSRLNGCELLDPLPSRSTDGRHFEEVLKEMNVLRREARVEMPNGVKQYIYFLDPTVRQWSADDLRAECDRTAQFARKAGVVTVLHPPQG